MHTVQIVPLVRPFFFFRFSDAERSFRKGAASRFGVVVMVKKYEFAHELVEHLHDIQRSISSASLWDVEDPANSKTFARLYREHLHALVDLHALAEEHHEFRDLLNQAMIFSHAYIWPCSHMDTRDRGKLIQLIPIISRFLLQGTSYEYRRDD